MICLAAEASIPSSAGWRCGEAGPLAVRGMTGQIAAKGTPAPVQASGRWPVERTHAWGNQFKKLAWNTERHCPVIDAYLALAHAIITLRRLDPRCAWTLYRWDTRRPRRL